jgi:GINS complex subunit 4
MNGHAQTEAVDLLSASSSSANNDHERILLVQLEIERVKYLLRAYLRIRTYKIETFSQYLLKNPAAKAKMSDVEMGYAERCAHPTPVAVRKANAWLM